MSNEPVREPPPGEISNLTNPYSSQPQRIVVASVFLFLTISSVIGRVYTRVVMKSFDLDDWVLIFSEACFVTFTVLLIVAGEYGDGTHLWNVTLADYSRDLFMQNVVEVFVCLASITVKYVILNQIRTIFFYSNRNTLTSKFITALIWFNLLFFTALGISFIFSCIPREKIWNPNIEGRCINIPVILIIGTSVNLISDTTILMTPIVAVSRLQMPTKKKIRVIIAFGIGIFALIAASMRLYYSLRLFHTEDNTWDISPIGQWIIAEHAVGYIIAFCPYLPRFFENILVYVRKGVLFYPSSHGPSSVPLEHLERIQVDRTWAVSIGRENSEETSSRDITLLEYPHGGDLAHQRQL
ncbi:hypothetical protein K445DRAFT_18341 [Daldinia sp. EC12]|nr:hypothetical protein K445DRAFT_18341 [Daldinia sp. EC12]